MPRQKSVITISQETRDGANPLAFIDLIIYQTVKPCRLVWLRYDLIWADSTQINYDDRPGSDGEWWFGNAIMFQIYRQQPPTTDPIFPAYTNQTVTFGHPMDNLICVRSGFVHKSPSPPYVVEEVDQEITLPEGVIEGVIAAPTGTGDVGPLSLTWIENGNLSYSSKNSEFGGTTVFPFHDTEKNLNIPLDTNDLLRLSGVYRLVDAVNTGQIFLIVTGKHGRPSKLAVLGRV